MVSILQMQCCTCLFKRGVFQMRPKTFLNLTIAMGALVFLAASSARPPHARLPASSQPILVVLDNGSLDRYQNFVPEMLNTEGLNEFQTAQLSQLTAAFLCNYDVVVLPHLSLSASQAMLFQDYANAGGTLVGFRPDAKLAHIFGVTPQGNTLKEGWIKINTATPYSSALVGDALKFHGAADLYSLSSASAVATLYHTVTSSTHSPAVAINRYGFGQAILFSFDLSQSIVLMRQGNPAWAGYPNNHDGNHTMRASQMFMDQGSRQFWNDLGDGTLNDVPQADIQLHLLTNLITLTNAAKRPLPRLWYFPDQARSLLLVTGDNHSHAVANALAEVDNISSHGGQFTYNLWYPFTTITESRMNEWLAGGNTMAIHFNDIAEADSSRVGGSAASWNGMRKVLNQALTSYVAAYPNAPYPVTTRNHYLVWVSNGADGTPDQVAQAKLFQNFGIQMDTSYASFPKRWGYMTGSGLPMKFLDTATGNVIPVYEQATQYEDDIQLGRENYSLNWDQLTAQKHYLQSLSDSLTRYNTAITMLFHPDSWNRYRDYIQSSLQYAQTRGIPIASIGKWLDFWKARSATTLSMPSFSSNLLSFTTTGSPAGLTVLAPLASGRNKFVSVFKVDGLQQNFTTATYQGVMYAAVVLTSGTHNISVVYATKEIIRREGSPNMTASTSNPVHRGSMQ